MKTAINRHSCRVLQYSAGHYLPLYAILKRRFFSPGGSRCAIICTVGGNASACPCRGSHAPILLDIFGHSRTFWPCLHRLRPAPFLHFHARVEKSFVRGRAVYCAQENLIFQARGIPNKNRAASWSALRVSGIINALQPPASSMASASPGRGC